MTLTIGWWIVPAFITLGTIGLAWGWNRKQTPSYGYAKAGAAAVSALGMAAAVIVSLVAWLIWAVLT